MKEKMELMSQYDRVEVLERFYNENHKEKIILSKVGE